MYDQKGKYNQVERDLLKQQWITIKYSKPVNKYRSSNEGKTYGWSRNVSHLLRMEAWMASKNKIYNQHGFDWIQHKFNPSLIPIQDITNMSTFDLIVHRRSNVIKKKRAEDDPWGFLYTVQFSTNCIPAGLLIKSPALWSKPPEKATSFTFVSCLA